MPPPASLLRLGGAVAARHGAASLLQRARRAATASAAAAKPGGVPETLIPSFDEVRVRQLGLQLQDTLVHYGKDVISRTEFLQCAGVVGLTRAEAQQMLVDLELSGGVFVSEDMVHLRPSVVFNKVNDEVGLPPADPCPDITRRIEVLQSELTSLEIAKARADEEVARKRLRFWSAVAVGSALQMSTFAFLTFPTLSGDMCLEWDIVEPISFFVTQAYIVLWFGYFYVTRREHTLAAFDERRLYSMSKEAYKRRKVDIVRWAAVRDELHDLQAKQKLYTVRSA